MTRKDPRSLRIAGARPHSQALPPVGAAWIAVAVSALVVVAIAVEVIPTESGSTSCGVGPEPEAVPASAIELVATSPLASNARDLPCPAPDNLSRLAQQAGVHEQTFELGCAIGLPQVRETSDIGSAPSGSRGVRGEQARPPAEYAKGTQPAVQAGLAWLERHQSADGSWDSDGFMAQCGSLEAWSSCDGPGSADHDVGLTGLCLLAFLGDGNTTREGPYKEQVTKAVKWLRDGQDRESGRFGQSTGPGSFYDHAIATLAMCETFYFSRSPLLRTNAQAAIRYVSRARNPSGAWRYDAASRDCDTSVTGWAIFAMKSAEEAGLEVDLEAYAGAARWIDQVTDPATGRTGYDTVGSASSRVPGRNDQYPTDEGEAMTAVAILSRVFRGYDVAQLPIVDKGADLLVTRMPEWDGNGLENDIYYWYYGSYALFQLGGPRWDAWNQAMKKALVENQRQDGDRKGSWDPLDAWGHAGGRVYMTSMAVLCLEVYYRYARVLRK